MGRSRLGVWGAVSITVASLVLWGTPSGAVPVDKEGDIKLGVRAYGNVRIGTNDFQQTAFYTKINGADVLSWRNWSFPPSPSGHLRQNRYFLEAELDHDLAGLVKRGVGPLALVNLLPFKISGLKYRLTYRGEWDSLYDWGPKEFSTADAWTQAIEDRIGLRNAATGSVVNVAKGRQRLRSLASQRNRLFQWFVEGTSGPLFVRFGRQILSWGETDGFRLLDNINPIDSSFGGFLISLDERRVPLDMLRAQYAIGNLGPFSEAFLEGYAAIDNKVAFVPGTPDGSPWDLPNSAPSATTQTFNIAPTQNFNNMRGGGRFVFNLADATFSLAQYFTFFDTPGVQSQVKPGYPLRDVGNPLGAVSAFPGGFSAQAFTTAPMVSVTGASTTFALPSLYTVVRSEAAYFQNEPRFSQFGLDPFMYAFYFKTCQGGAFNGQACTSNAQCGGNQCGGGPNGQELVDCKPFRKCWADRARVFGAGVNPTGGRRTGKSFNYVLGLDINQYIRFLNPQQTFFISTQFFWKHLFDPLPRTKLGKRRPDGTWLDSRIPLQGEVLPVLAADTIIDRADLRPFGANDPDFVHQPTDTFLHTLFIGTAYFSGKLNPGFVFFYDWGGAYVFQPSLALVQDPFRFVIDYSILSAHTLKGGSGVSLLRDRDNIQLRLEYVI